MSNIILILDSLVESKKITKTSSVGGDCNATSTCEYVQESSVPLACEQGDKIILFFKDLAVTLNGTGVIVGDIISRRFERDQYHYTVQYDDALLAPGIPPNTLTQCDILNSCCYDCVAQYSDITIPAPPILPAFPPEHTSIGGEANFVLWNVNTLTCNIGTVIGPESPQTIITNPSLDRSMIIRITDVVWATIAATNIKGFVEIYRSDNDGPFVLINLLPIGSYGNINTTIEEFPMTLVRTLLPGEQYKIKVQVHVRIYKACTNFFNGNKWSFGGSGVTYLGSTV